MERRELFKVLAVGAIAAHEVAGQHQHPLASSASDIANYRPRFFSEPEYQIVNRLCDIVIPPDAQSPGAAEAGVAFYIDTVLHYGDASAQELWRRGLAGVDEAARGNFANPFLQCNRGEQERIVALMARHEATPETEIEKFFVILKLAIVDAYVISESGIRQYLRYRGDTMLSEFPGCTHPEHQT
jgi:hypothetical protein